jgi:hypothetical protein
MLSRTRQVATIVTMNASQKMRSRNRFGGGASYRRGAFCGAAAACGSVGAAGGGA